ncbi:putative cytochrome P450 [Apiosordaria backusii]|uniref:Cytochrome P450 n=1 Tax=Apiosordaria backusii TaxID=314023 RepID=A0AA40K656_9PEZI|nr:putative cytochrome P450 [Apiosordaria backusii]
MLLELLPRPIFLVPALCAVYFLLASIARRSRLPKIPIVGARKGDWFPHLQAKWRNTRDFKAAMEEAHTNYRDRAVIVPVASMGNLVMLPHAEAEFVSDQPDSVLSFNERAAELYQIDYTFTDPTVARVTLHNSLLKTALTPQIGNLIPVMADEAAWVFDKHWGITTDQWHELCVFETMRHIVGGVANRALIGLPFCRDPELVNSGMAFAVDIPLSGAIMNLFPKPFRPLVAPLVTLPNRIHTRRFRKILVSEIERRLKEYDARQANPDDKSLGPEPNDFLQWSLQQAKASGNPFMWRKETLADRVLIVNFAAIHTTSFASTWAIFDLICSPPEQLDELREEITSVLAANNGKWTKRTLAQLEKLDSALRESARLSSILTVGLGRFVTNEEGLTTPSGVHLPKGTHITVPVYSVLRDDTIYTDADSYIPLRFHEQNKKNQSDASVKRVANTLPTTSPDFLVFGHGKHACPGRFFAAAELKILLAYAILHYDFERPPVKPEGPWYAFTRVPPMKATIKVRKRQRMQRI